VDITYRFEQGVIAHGVQEADRLVYVLNPQRVSRRAADGITAVLHEAAQTSFEHHGRGEPSPLLFEIRRSANLPSAAPVVACNKPGHAVVVIRSDLITEDGRRYFEQAVRDQLHNWGQRG